MQFNRSKSRQLIGFIDDKQDHKPVLILAGARQVGKTTLIQETLHGRPQLLLNLEEHPSFADTIDTFENFNQFEAYLKEVHRFDHQKQVLIIDEAQQSLKLGSFVRFMKEKWQSATVILTGSAINELHLETYRRPVGRETYLDLWPLLFTEFLQALGQDSLVTALEKFELGDTLPNSTHERLLEMMDQYLNVGGLPEVVTYFIKGKDYKKLRRDIFKSYEDDFIRYFSLEDVNLFKRCVDAVAANAGSPSKDTQAVRLDAPGYKKVAAIFARLEKWKLLIKCEQVGLKPEKNKAHPKRYLYDVGVLADLRLKGLQTLSLKDLSHPVLRTPLGGIIENYLAISLTDQFEEIFGIKLSSQAEIDFAIKRGGIVTPIEVKINQRFKLNHLTSVTSYLDRMSTKGFAILFYGGPPLAEKQGNGYVLPYYLVDSLTRLLA
jgi:predicted AAA+ superfamily ATPase